MAKNFYRLKKISFLVFILLFLFMNTAPVLVQAVTAQEAVGHAKDAQGNKKANPAAVKLDDPLGATGHFPEIANRIIKAALGISGVLALLAFIYGGIMWLISGGDDAKIKKGKDIMVWAIWGLAIIFGSYAILNLIFKALGAS